MYTVCHLPDTDHLCGPRRKHPEARVPEDYKEQNNGELGCGRRRRRSDWRSAARRARRSGGTGICQKQRQAGSRRATAPELRQGPKWERHCRREEDREPREPRPPLPRSSGRAPPTASPGPLRRSNLCPQNLLPRRPPLDLSAPVTSRRHQPVAPAQLSASLGPPRAPRPRSLPGVPFPERGFEQRRDVRTLGVQVRRSAFRHLLPLAVAEAAATAAAARPGALWEWRPRPRPAGRSVPNGTRGRGAGGVARRGARCVRACALLPPRVPARPAARRGRRRPRPLSLHRSRRARRFLSLPLPWPDSPCHPGPSLAAATSKYIFADSLLLEGGAGWDMAESAQFRDLGLFLSCSRAQAH